MKEAPSAGADQTGNSFALVETINSRGTGLHRRSRRREHPSSGWHVDLRAAERPTRRKIGV